MDTEFIEGDDVIILHPGLRRLGITSARIEDHNLQPIEWLIERHQPLAERELCEVLAENLDEEALGIRPHTRMSMVWWCQPRFMRRIRHRAAEDN